MSTAPQALELLAPARDRQTAIAAINCGADAVYIGGPHHGARAAAANSIEDIRELCRYAHLFHAKVYVTLNTLVYDSELDEVQKAVRELWMAGVDALIVQDMSLLRMNLPPIALHASTQCDTRTPQRARFLQDVGMDCIVLPREFSLDEIRRVAQEVDVPLEGFVHGALCVCYSGDCRASLLNGGRSANRGECAQICRLPYNLTDKSGRVLVANRHLLSLRDLERKSRLADLADAGIRSFKIEGRLKAMDYVMNTVLAYSQALDDLCDKNPDKYCRASAGRVITNFCPDVERSFNRGFTPFFIDGVDSVKPASLSQPLTPKWTGRYVGKVKSTRGRTVVVDGNCEFRAGDGLGYFDSNDKFCGFRVNTVNGRNLTTTVQLDIAPGTALYRNLDKAFDDSLKSARIERRIPVKMSLRSVPGGIALSIEDSQGCRVESMSECQLDSARSPQGEARRNTLAKLGDTIYILEDLQDNLGDKFVPLSVLTALRRHVADMLSHTRAARRPLCLRRPENKDITWPEGDSLSFHSNVANKLADRFYREHGVRKIEPALELSSSNNTETVVMSSRFCLRRELNACLKSKNASKLPRELYLENPDGRVRRMRVDCDCASCTMHLIAMPSV